MAITEAEWRVNVIILSSVVIVIIVTLLLLTIKQLFFTSANESFSIFQLKLFAIGQMICYLATYISALLNVIFGTEKTLFYQINYVVFVICLICGLMSSHLFLVYRYYFAFIDTTFAMTKIFLYFQGFVVISIPTYISLTIYFHYINSYSLIVLFSIFGTGLTFISYLSLIYGFNRNLFKLVLKHRQETIIKVNKYNMKPALQDRPSSLNTHQVFMIEQITKQTLLGLFHASCILIVVFVCIVFFVFDNVYTNVNETVFIMILSWAVSITIIAGLICVYLGFTFNANVYQLCCSTCHLKCQGFCESLAEKECNELEQIDRQKDNHKNNIENKSSEIEMSPTHLETESPSDISIDFNISDTD